MNATGKTTYGTFDRRLRHQNIVTLYGIVPLKRSDELGIVMELVSGGTLTDLQNKYDEFDDEGLIPLADVIEVAIQIASGLKYTHSRRLAHLDIKADNILVRSALI
jgi:serine/threonine protein kinase